LRIGEQFVERLDEAVAPGAHRVADVDQVHGIVPSFVSARL
jgi:hypothetical protein